MKALQLLSDGRLWQRWRLDDLNPFHVVDEEVETGFPATTRRPHAVSCPHRPDQRDPPTDDGAAEGDVDDKDDPAVRVVAPECYDARDDVDDAGDEKYDA